MLVSLLVDLLQLNDSYLDPKLELHMSVFVILVWMKLRTEGCRFVLLFQMIANLFLITTKINEY